MAYNNNDEVVNELLALEKNARGDIIRVASCTSASGDISYDIRNMYTKEDGTLGFTAKGIRIKSDLMKKVIVEIMRDLLLHEKYNFDYIMEQLNNMNVPEDTGE